MFDTIPPGPYHYLDFDRALEKMGDLPALTDLLGMLQVSLMRDIPQIEVLLKQDNVLLANRMLHALKGFIPIFCGDTLCDEVAAVELLSRTGSAAEVALAYAPLRSKLGLLRQDVEQSLSAGGALFENGGAD